MSAVLTTQHLTKRLFGEVPVTLVEDINLSINRGEFVCIMGPSGSGKSSLLYLLGLLDIPSQGKIWLDGEDTSTFGENDLAKRRLEKLGFVFQFHFLLAEFSILDNVALPMRRLGGFSEQQIRGRAMDLLERLDVAKHAKKWPHQISGGQRQRVAIARALINDPLIILADEPTGNLDTQSSNRVKDILADLAHDMQKTVVAVSHDIDFARRADTQINLIDGHLQPSSE